MEKGSLDAPPFPVYNSPIDKGVCFRFMIGFYNLSVWLTYVGLASAVFGMIEGIRGNVLVAVLCLLVSTVCDMFDGKIARAMKRTEDEKAFGIQIDSLCDLVCFGVFPAILAYTLGVQTAVGIAVLIFYTLAGVIRLAYFNVTEAKRQQTTDECRRFYQGLPITSIGAILPILCALRSTLGAAFSAVLTVGMGVTGLLFILNLRVPKPRGAALYIMLGLGAALAALYFLLA